MKDGGGGAGGFSLLALLSASYGYSLGSLGLWLHSDHIMLTIFHLYALLIKLHAAAFSTNNNS